VRPPSAEALRGLEERASAALARGDEHELEILGYGEISCVLALDDGGERYACKRLPPFHDRARFERYHAVFERYLGELREGGVVPLDSEMVAVPRPDGDLGVYVVQPRQPKPTLLVPYLAQATEAEAARVFGVVLDAILTTVQPTRGLDGQLSNWVWAEGGLRYLDVTTPMLRDTQGRDLLDVELFLASLPWALRGAVRRFMLAEILDKYFDRRGVVLDLLGNLFKEGLERLLPAFLAAANERLAPALTASEVWRYYDGDAGTWALLLRIRRMDRWWQRAVRRRTYPFLLPGPIERNRARPDSIR
jgi:hypothetical protein